MRIAKVIGTVTLSQIHPNLVGGRFKVAIPLNQAQLTDDANSEGDDLVVYDEFGVGMEDKIFLSEGAEAAQPFYPDIKPIDAYNAGIIDKLEIVD